jgi:hypothetical protein
MTAPEPRDRMTAGDWHRVERHAAPQSIEVHLKRALRARDDAQRLVDRWEALLAVRLAQVAGGTWPPPVERVTWRELRKGDVLLDDPDRETPVEEEPETTWDRNGEWTTVRFHIGTLLYSRSAPAGREVAIKPRTGTGEESSG